MSSYADTIRDYIEASPPERARNERTAAAINLTLPAIAASDALNALLDENQRLRVALTDELEELLP